MIDTRAAAQDLEAAGADPKPAEAIVRTVRRPDDDLVTRAELRAGLAQLEQRLTLWIVGIVAVANGLLNWRSAFETLPSATEPSAECAQGRPACRAHLRQAAADQRRPRLSPLP